MPTHFILRWGSGPSGLLSGYFFPLFWYFIQDLPMALFVMSFSLLSPFCPFNNSVFHFFFTLLPNSINHGQAKFGVCKACKFSFLPIQSFFNSHFSVSCEPQCLNTHKYLCDTPKGFFDLLFPLFSPFLCGKSAVCILKETYWSSSVKVKWKGKDLKAAPSTGKNLKGGLNE